MTAPEPITIGGRRGTVVYLDDAWHPVPVAKAVAAKVLFENGDSAFYTVGPSAVHLRGNEHSGNHGHAGRPGEIGGSAPSFAVRQPTEADQQYIREHTSLSLDMIDVVADKPGGLVIFPIMSASKEPTPYRLKTVLEGEDARKLAVEMAQGLPGYVTVRIEPGGNLTYEGPTIDFLMNAKATDGSSARVNVERQFIREKDGTLNVYEGVIEVRNAQGKGLAKELLKTSMPVYQRMGATKVTMNANLDVGGYAWAKFGFKADDPAKLGRTLEQRVVEGFIRDGVEKGATVLDGVSKADKAGLQAVIVAHMNDPKLPWHVANTVTSKGRMIGKAVMLEAVWHATLRLDDKEAMQKFNAYVNRK